MATTNTAQKLLQDFCDAYKARDLSKTLSLLTRQASMIGTAADEKRVGLNQIENQLKRDWSQSEAGEIKILSFLPSLDSATWACADMETTITANGKAHHFKDFRGTVVIEQEDGVWKISHTHFSFPDYRNPEDGSFPIPN